MNGTLSEVGRISHMVLRRPQDAFVSQQHIDSQWRMLKYTERPSFEKAVEEYDTFVKYLTDCGITMDFLPAHDSLSLDSLYVRDATIVSHRGVILCNMGKPERSHEPAVAGDAFRRLAVPVMGAIQGDGRLEGGDVVWLDDQTLAVGRTYRTNAEGINQLRSLLHGEIEVIPVHLPHYRGPGDVFHLMSIFSPLDHDLAMVYSPLMPITFRELLVDRGVSLIEVPHAEFETMGCNILAIAPSRCVVLKGNPETKQVLEEAGVEVWEMEGEEICMKGQGGPTCLTRPLIRE
ncbi:MAG: hypothetical protein HXS53_03095 [Theionarchaea archaeon]|nr:hypothetical protein [Theionarchaea archaeon]